MILFTFYGQLPIIHGILRKRPHAREKEDLLDAFLIGEDHGNSVDANPNPACWRHAVLHCLDEILIEWLRLVVTLPALLSLLHELAPLLNWIRQLRVCVCAFLPAH